MMPEVIWESSDAGGMHERKFLFLQFISTSNTRVHYIGIRRTPTYTTLLRRTKNKELDKQNIQIKFKSKDILEISNYLKFERRKYTKWKYIFYIVKIVILLWYQNISWSVIYSRVPQSNKKRRLKNLNYSNLISASQFARASYES